jgi:hypothetical protein
VANINSREEGIDVVVGEKRCDHASYPLRVVATQRGKRAQCLGCKEFGPEGQDTEAAQRALLLSLGG